MATLRYGDVTKQPDVPEDDGLTRVGTTPSSCPRCGSDNLSITGMIIVCVACKQWSSTIAPKPRT